MADIDLSAVRRVELLTPFDQRFEFRTQRLQLADLHIDLIQLGGEEPRYMATRGAAFGANGEYATDLGQRQAGNLGSSDEGDSFDCSSVVDSVAIGLSVGLS